MWVAPTELSHSEFHPPIHADDLRAALPDRCQYIPYDFPTWLGAEVTFAMNANADCLGLHVPITDDEHGVDFHFFGVGDFRFDMIGARVEFSADLMGPELVEDGAGIIEKRRFVADGKNTDLLRVEPEREIAGVMFDQETDET